MMEGEEDFWIHVRDACKRGEEPWAKQGEPQVPRDDPMEVTEDQFHRMVREAQACG